MMAFHVRQWDEEHETHESRKLVRLPWVRVPTKHDGLGYRNIVRQKNRCELLACWKLILEVAAKADRGQRGWLVRGGKALSAFDLATMTGLSEETFEASLKFFQEAPTDWLEWSEFPAEPGQSAAVSGGSPGVPAESAAEPGQSAATRRKSPAMAPVDQSRGDERRSDRRERSGGGGSEVAASRTQAGALLSQIRDLEARKDELSSEERAELRKKRASLQSLQKKQAAGDFSPVQTS